MNVVGEVACAVASEKPGQTALMNYLYKMFTDGNNSQTTNCVYEESLL